MTPATREPIVQLAAAVWATAVAQRVDFGLTHRHMFSNRVSLDLQLLQLSLHESKFAIARVAAEMEFVYIAALM